MQVKYIVFGTLLKRALISFRDLKARAGPFRITTKSPLTEYHTFYVTIQNKAHRASCFAAAKLHKTAGTCVASPGTEQLSFSYYNIIYDSIAVWE